MSSLQAIQTRFDKLQITSDVTRKLYASQIKDAEANVASLIFCQETLKQAVDVFTKISELSRRETLDKVEKLITFVLRSILANDTYSFFINDTEHRNNIVYQFSVSRYGQPPTPLVRASGGGVRDIVSVFLSMIVSILQNPEQRRFFAFDERFGHLSKEHQSRISHTLKYFAEKLGCQFLGVSQHDEMCDVADKIYRFSFHKDGSLVKLVSKEEMGTFPDESTD